MRIEHDIEKMNRKNFRSCLEAAARPGESQPLLPLFGSGLLAAASVLLYAEVTHYYEGNLNFQLIRAICGSHSTSPAKADYLFYDTTPEALPCAVKTGTPECPELGATLLFACPPAGGSGLNVIFSGPGIEGRREGYLPVNIDFIQWRKEKNASFPMGIDIFFVIDDNTLLGIPRTTTIEVLS